MLFLIVHLNPHKTNNSLHLFNTASYELPKSYKWSLLSVASLRNTCLPESKLLRRTWRLFMTYLCTAQKQFHLLIPINATSIVFFCRLLSNNPLFSPGTTTPTLWTRFILCSILSLSPTINIYNNNNKSTYSVLVNKMTSWPAPFINKMSCFTKNNFIF